MTTEKRQFTLRVQEAIFDKISVISDREKRSIALQIEYVLERFITDYEREHGPIMK